MNRATAANVAQAITNLGLPCSVIASVDINSGWKIVVNLRVSDNITPAAIAAFVTAQGVSGIVTGVELS